jgi:hypothetical protein
VQIVFVRERIRESTATIHRPDGVVVELPSFSRKHRVPHDLAHAVAERRLGLARGIYGTIAAGGMFANMRVVAGRPRHDAAQRSERILRANARELGLSEVLGGALHHAVEHGQLSSVARRARKAWESLNPEPCPYDREQLEDAAFELDLLTQAWVQLGVGQGLEFAWPARLISAVPRPEPRRRETGPRLRRAG